MSPGETVRDYYRAMGRLETELKIIQLIKRNICQDCEHPSCYDLTELIEDIRNTK